MNGKQFSFLIIFSFLLFAASCKQTVSPEARFADFAVDPKSANVEMFWRDDNGKPFKSLQNLKNFAESKNRRLRFAMNGGMYEKKNLPKGLFVQNNQTITPLDTKTGDGNFYLKPNGVFYLTDDNRAFVVPTENFTDDGNVKFATQSGPMLIINHKINRIFDKDSVNLNIRNAVCVLPDNKIVFTISKLETNFHEFAEHLKSLNCRDALYLDGFVSRMYLPEQQQLDGDFAVIIGVTE